MSALVQIISIRRKRLLKKVREEGSSGFGLTEENTFQLARVSPGGNADSTRGNPPWWAWWELGSVHAQGGHSVDLLTHTGHLHTVLSVLNASYSETFFFAKCFGYYFIPREVKSWRWTSSTHLLLVASAKKHDPSREMPDSDRTSVIPLHCRMLTVISTEISEGSQNKTEQNKIRIYI